jgi:Uma2 family endonuclease
MATTDFTRRRFTIDEYHRMAETGIFGSDERMELIDGEIVSMSPMGSRHAAVIRRIERMASKAVAESGLVQTQMPIKLNGDSEPEPDLAIVRSRDDFYEDEHARADDVLLLIEVSDSSLNYDSTTKRDLFARHCIAEYWVVDLNSDTITVYQAADGNHYSRKTSYSRGESFNSPAINTTIAVNECLGGE